MNKKHILDYNSQIYSLYVLDDKSFNIIENKPSENDLHTLGELSSILDDFGLALVNSLENITKDNLTATDRITQHKKFQEVYKNLSNLFETLCIKSNII